ncbi:MAG: LmbE family protein [Geminicoccaceae bacterium]|jgi:LmbE family N-acetylglucosaminyl deacetylase|nr:LmbE family protein [Geminicoccaceae bacterium]
MRRAFVFLAVATQAPFVEPVGAQGIPELHESISGLSNPMRVLVIAAHPDDEDTQLITWLARGRHVETAYLSLTRGDGGQNIIGNELGEALGVIRTEELLAARRIDGGRQYFTRAYDFGFSKNAEETFRHWPRDSILRDVVTVVRSFKPHVIVAMFSGTPRDGHGHHQASGILARDAYDLAGDTVRLPRAATYGQGGWTPLKFYRGAWGSRDQPGVLRINVGQFDAMLGRSYAEIAAQSRSQHKSQAFGSLEPKGVRFTQVRREASRVNENVPAEREQSMFDGIDTTWARFKTPGLHPVLGEVVDRVTADIASVNAAPYLTDPSSALGPLMSVASALAPLAGSDMPVTIDLVNRAPVTVNVPADLRAAARVAYGRAARSITLAGGIAVEAQVPRELIATADSAPLTVTVYNRGRVPMRAEPSRFFRCPPRSALPDGGPIGARRVWELDSAATVLPDSARTWKGVTCASREPVSDGPWWLEAPRQGDMFGAASVVMTEAEASRGPVVRLRLALAGTASTTPVEIEAPIVYRYADPIRGDVSRPLAYVPAISVTLDRAIEYAPARTPLARQVRVQLRSAATTPRDVRVSLSLPTGLRADSGSRSVTLPSYGAVRSVTFSIRGELSPGRHVISAVAEANGRQFASGYAPVEYDHIRPQRLYRDATVAMEAVDVTLPPDATIAYIQGVGDNSAPMLQQLGLRVSALDPADIPRTELSRFNAIVVGPRAYESNDVLVANNAALLEYVRRGGTMVVQYGQYEMQRPGMMPYPITIARPADRVTDEASPVRVLDADARVLTYPNAIGAADFTGWIQDRSLYMPRTHAPEYAPVVATNDPGEQPNDGGILVARYGTGTYVYTTLAFFRQLPNGVPGAARLFVNLLAANAGDGRPVQ